MVLVVSIALAALAWAADSPVGTWVRQPSAEDKGMPQMTMTIDKWRDDGARLAYHMIGGERTITISSALDGSEAPIVVDGKPSGQTMSIKRVDDLHATSVQKVGGKTVGTSRVTFSPDFTRLTIESDYTAPGPGHGPGKSTELWLRK
jgi:hypothetical protein